MLTRVLSIMFIYLLLQNGAWAQVALGLYAGLDQSKLYGDTPPGFEYDFKQGYVLGISLDFRVSPDVFLSLRPNLTRNGASVVDTDTSLVIEDVIFNVINTHYVMLPVIAQIYVTRGFYANAGFDVGWLASAEAGEDGETSLHPQVADYTANAIFGFGFSIPMGRTSFNLEMSYAQGLTTFTKKERIDNGSVPRLRASRLRLSGYFVIFTGKKRIKKRKQP